MGMGALSHARFARGSPAIKTFEYHDRYSIGDFLEFTTE